MQVLTFVKALLRHFLTKERAEIGMAAAGLVALVTPLMLWVAWSKEMLKIVLMVGFASFLLATFFAQYAAPETVDPDEERLPRPGEDPMLHAENAKRDTWRDVS